MDAGREMDAAVAERVMGWHLPDDPDLPVAWVTCNNVWAGWWAREPTLEQDEGYYEDNGMFVPLRSWLIAGSAPWAPSTNIAAAWQVVERMHETKWVWVLSGDDIGFYCRFFQGEDPPHADYNHISMPLAICRAALQAIDVQDKP